MNKRTEPKYLENGRYLSEAELDRNQKRYDIAQFTNHRKAAILNVLTQFPDFMGQWRFTNAAIWVNLDCEALLDCLDQHILEEVDPC